MPSYVIRWEIDLDADTPVEAAKFARTCQVEQLLPHRWCGVFDVIDEEGNLTKIDLDEIEQEKPFP